MIGKMKNKSMADRQFGMQKLKQRRLRFFVLGITIPLLQFLIMWVYVNFDSFALAFQKYEIFGENAGKYVFDGLNNFRDIIDDFKAHSYLRDGIWRGFCIYLVSIVQMPLHIFIAWYAVKNKPFASAAHIILYIPGILSGMVTASITKYALCEAAPAIVKLLTGKEILSLLDSGNHLQTFWVIVGDSFLMGVTANLLLYAGSMNSISDSVLEAAELDGVTQIQEFWYIYLPLVLPTISTIFVVGLGGILTSDIGLFSYYGEDAPGELFTVGYYLTIHTVKADYSTYPFVSALGMMIMAVTIPITLLGRKICDKIQRRFE